MSSLLLLFGSERRGLSLPSAPERRDLLIKGVIQAGTWSSLMRNVSCSYFHRGRAEQRGTGARQEEVPMIPVQEGPYRKRLQ